MVPIARLSSSRPLAHQSPGVAQMHSSCRFFKTSGLMPFLSNIYDAGAYAVKSVIGFGIGICNLQTDFLTYCAINEWLYAFTVEFGCEHISQGGRGQSAAQWRLLWMGNCVQLHARAVLPFNRALLFVLTFRCEGGKQVTRSRIPFPAP